MPGTQDSSSSRASAGSPDARHAGAGVDHAGVTRPPLLGDPWAGRVLSFDDAAGLGVVEATTGARFGFHCTSVADGSRHVEPGTAVAFRLRPARGGQIEAIGLVVAILSEAGSGR